MSEANAMHSTPDGSGEIDFMELDSIIDEEFDKDKENLIMILQAIQRHYNYLPRPALTYLSAKIGIPYSKIYGVATFYSTFSLEPRGRNIISICLGTACHVRGANGSVNACRIRCRSATARPPTTSASRWNRCAASDAAASDRW